MHTQISFDINYYRLISHLQSLLYSTDQDQHYNIKAQAVWE